MTENCVEIRKNLKLIKLSYFDKDESIVDAP